MPIKKLVRYLQSDKAKKFFKNRGGVIDKGSVYVTVILTLLIFGGFILAGGTLPTKLPKPNTDLVNIVTQPFEPTKSSLQLQTFYGITPTSVPTQAPVPTISDSEPRLIDCGRQVLGPSRPEMIWGFSYDSTPASGNEKAFKVFYTNKNALLLGSGAVSPMNTHPSDHVINPALGNTAIKDQDNFPIFPAVYITDITQITTDISGDAQLGGQPNEPDDIYGTWKAQGEADPERNGQLIGSGADLLPGANGPPGNHDLTFTSETIWRAANLKAIDPGTHQYSTIQDGHTYRIQIALHDGANPRNVGVACVQLAIPGAAPSPAPSTSNPLRYADLNPLGTPGGSNPECGIANPELRLSKDSSGKCCVMDGPVNNVSECCTGVPTCKEIMDAGGSLQREGVMYSCNMSPESQAALWCDAKPVIYLYPEFKTIVDVSLKVPGTIPVSDPLYPANGGWKNIEAYPDGTFIYQGKSYKELFYEANITPIEPPQNGFIVSKLNLKSSLKDITTKLGLIKNEQQEFLEYWVPRLNDMDSPYFHISVFSPEQKEIIDHVDITPKPDTFIQFIMYYKPLQKPINIKPLKLPDTPPARIGFTAVEWGGIIDN